MQPARAFSARRVAAAATTLVLAGVLASCSSGAKPASTAGVALQSTPIAGVLLSVSCTSQTSCTSVGYLATSITPQGAPITSATLATVGSHAGWREIRTALVPGGQSSQMSSVSCVGATCRAVGFTEADQVVYPIVEASTASADWIGQPSPALPPVKATSCTARTGCPLHVGGLLAGISCVSTSNCIAVGADNWRGDVLAESWNGKTWARLDAITPLHTGLNQLSSVSCASATDCTAVGFQDSSTGDESTLVEHWNGRSWSLEHAPNPSGASVGTWTHPGGSYLTSVSCTAGGCGAIGSYVTTAGTTHTFAEHSNGSSWTLTTTPSPNASSAASFLYTSGLKSIACAGSTCVAVGGYQTSPGRWSNLVETWNGSTWRMAAAPKKSTWWNSQLRSVWCSSADFCTATGSFQSHAGGGEYQIVAHWDGHSWTS